MTPSELLAVVVAATAGVVLLAAAFAAGLRTTGEGRAGRRTRLRELELVAGAFDRISTPVLLVAGDGRVLRSSQEAERLGLVRGGYLVHAELRHLITERLDRGEGPDVAGATALTLSRGPVGERQVEVRATTAVLGRHVLLDVENRSEAMRVEDVRRDFVVNVSHELKTPVGAISVLAETLETAIDDPDAVRRFTARIRQECARLQVLVADVLELSRVQVVEAPTASVPVSLDDVVTEAVAAVRERAAEHDIAITRTGPSGAQVLGDAELLTTAVRNLLVNAVAYSPPETRVTVSVARRDGLAVVQVTDRGIGIPVGEQERIFERFYRVDPARSRRTGGTGLGLAIVKHVVDSHGGDVQLWSRPGQGSTFTVRLPERDPDAGTGDRTGDRTGENDPHHPLGPATPGGTT